MILQNLAKLHNMLDVSLFVRSESLYTCLGWQKKWSVKSWLRFTRKCGHSSR